MNTSDSRSDELTSSESILDDLFHGCAFTAFVEQALASQTWPCPDATRRQAYDLYESALAASPKNP